MNEINSTRHLFFLIARVQFLTEKALRWLIVVLVGLVIILVGLVIILVGLGIDNIGHSDVLLGIQTCYWAFRRLA